MKRIAILSVFCISFFCVQAAAQEQTQPAESKYDAALAKRLGADDYGMRNYVFVMLKTGKAEITDESRRKEIFDGHFANMGRLAKEGLLVAAGPFEDPAKIKRGFFIFNVTTVEEAKKLVESDPGVESGIFDYELTKLYSSAALMMIGEIHKTIQKTEIK